MSSIDDHRWPVCAKNMATGAARRFTRAHHLARFAWFASMGLYTFIACMLGLHIDGFIAWEIYFALYWAAVWGWADERLSGQGS